MFYFDNGLKEEKKFCSHWEKSHNHCVCVCVFGAVQKWMQAIDSSIGTIYQYNEIIEYK